MTSSSDSIETLLQRFLAVRNVKEEDFAKIKIACYHFGNASFESSCKKAADLHDYVGFECDADVLFVYFDFIDEERKSRFLGDCGKGMSTHARKVCFVLCGDSPHMPGPTDEDERKDRSLATLRIHMVVHPLLDELGTEHGPPIIFPFFRPSAGGGKQPISEMGVKQLNMLAGGGKEVFELSESWFISCSPTSSNFLEQYSNMYENSFSNGVLWGQQYVLDQITTMIATDPRAGLYTLTEKHEEYRNKLALWVSTQLDKFDEDGTFRGKMTQKYKSREGFGLILMRKAKSKFYATMKREEATEVGEKSA